MSTMHSANDSAANGQTASPPSGKAGPAIDAALAAVTREFHSLVADIEDLVQATGALTGEELARAKLKLKARVSAARSYIGDVAGDMSDQARSTAKSADAYVRAQPWRVIGVTAAAALLIGFLLGRRR
jgi:ElaB/YqjD/DUF883 family membrane-anchored ribosome-binding protein